MPFEHPARHVFMAVSMTRNAPQQEDLYGISNAREWIFIGVARDIRAAFLKHLHEMDTTVTFRHPTGSRLKSTLRPARVARFEQLIREYQTERRT